MLRITVPHVDLWNGWHVWFGNRPEGLEPLRDKVDEACRDTGRDPAEIGRTVAVMVQFPGGTGRPSGDAEQWNSPAVPGSVEALVPALRSYADAGISHVQLVLDPITEASIAALAPVLEALDS